MFVCSLLHVLCYWNVNFFLWKRETLYYRPFPHSVSDSTVHGNAGNVNNNGARITRGHDPLVIMFRKNAFPPKQRSLQITNCSIAGHWAPRQMLLCGGVLCHGRC